MQKMGNALRGFLGFGQPAASSSDAPPLAASDQHAKDPAVAGSGTDPSTLEENFLNQIGEIGAAEQWEATPPEEKSAVLAAAIKLNTDAIPLLSRPSFIMWFQKAGVRIRSSSPCR